MSPFEQYLIILAGLVVIFVGLMIRRPPEKDDGPLTPEEQENVRMLQAALRDYRKQCRTRYHVQSRKT